MKINALFVKDKVYRRNVWVPIRTIRGQTTDIGRCKNLSYSLRVRHFTCFASHGYNPPPASPTGNVKIFYLDSKIEGWKGAQTKIFLMFLLSCYGERSSSAAVLFAVRFRVKAPVTRCPPHSPGREDFPHPVPRFRLFLPSHQPIRRHPDWRITMLPF